MTKDSLNPSPFGKPADSNRQGTALVSDAKRGPQRRARQLIFDLVARVGPAAVQVALCARRSPRAWTGSKLLEACSKERPERPRVFIHRETVR